jgi:outer membrane protein assembly factor BamB
VVDGIVYFGSNDKYQRAVDAETGEEIWKYKFPHRLYSSPVVLDGVIYIGCWDGHMYALH